MVSHKSREADMRGQLDGRGLSRGIPDRPELPEEFEQLLGSHVVAIRPSDTVV